MALSQVSFDVQNPQGGTAPGNRTFTGHVFLFAHGHCELYWDHTRACATDFLAHNTCGTRACCASTKTTRFGLTMHPWVRYHLSFLQVHCHMMTHPCQSDGRSTKQTKFCCFRGPHASMCHTSVWLCTQLRTIGYLCSFNKGREGAHPNQPTTISIHLGIQKNRPCHHLPKKEHMHTSKRKDNTNNKGSKIRSRSQENWPINGQGGYVTPAASGIPTASKRGAKSEVAHKWARWLRHPCRLGDPHRFRAGGKIRSGP